MAARHVGSIAQALRVSSSSNFPAFQQPSRRFAAGAGHHEARVNFWEAPTSPSKWKEEHMVLICLAGWGVIFTGAYKAFGGKKEKKPEKAEALTK